MAADAEGTFPLDLALLQDEGEDISALLLTEYGAIATLSWDSLTKKAGQRILRVAAAAQNMGDLLHHVDSAGVGALHWAARDGNEKLVEMLIANGAYLDVTLADGWTPLHFAATRGHVEIVELLIINFISLKCIFKFIIHFFFC